MDRQRWVWIAVLLLTAAAAGLVAGVVSVMATGPAGEESPRGRAEYPASVYYDEHWAAAGALVTSANSSTGFQAVDPSKGAASETAALIRKDGDGKWGTAVQPRMVVTRWRVHGHIHFQ